MFALQAVAAAGDETESSTSAFLAFCLSAPAVLWPLAPRSVNVADISCRSTVPSSSQLLSATLCPQNPVLERSHLMIISSGVAKVVMEWNAYWHPGLHPQARPPTLL